MTKANSLSSDINFIKEFEELKLKQKLLVETLNKKHGALRDEHLININSKLDFLVNLFKDANETPEVDPHKEIMTAFEELTKRIDSLETSFNDKVTELESKMNTTYQSSDKPSKQPTINLDYDDIETRLNPHKETVGIRAKKVEHSPPIPDFTVKNNVEEKVSELTKETLPKEEKKKRKWF